MVLSPDDPRALPGTRIQVVGTSGSGKTTLARTVSRRLGVSHVELDAIHWQPGWTPRAKEDFCAAVAAALAGPAFVVDGNYSAPLGNVVRERIDTLLWLDYTFPLVMRQVVVRTLRRIVAREALWNGNRESVALQFSKDSIILWVIQTYGRRRRGFPVRFASAAYDGITVIRFRNPTQVKRWLARIAGCRGRESGQE
jgi:adenylate kinase family enzyme